MCSRILAAMRIRRAVASLSALAMAFSVAGGCAPSPVEDEASYLREIAAHRAAKNAAFRQPGSPVPPEKQDELLPLAYFDPSLTYRVPAVLRMEAEQPTMEMPTSTGQQRLMRRVGTLEFSLKGEPLTLGAFIEAGSADVNRLFVPFTDLTSGTETYPAGRYLDLDRTRTGLYIIDFNQAYNPYCYYNPTYDCPFPPRGNRLTLPVRAGEKVQNAIAPGTPARSTAPGR